MTQPHQPDLLPPVMPPCRDNEDIPGFTRLAGNLYRCQICERAQLGRPIQKQTAKNTHLSSAEHREAVKLLQAQQSRVDARRVAQLEVESNWQAAVLPEVSDPGAANYADEVPSIATSDASQFLHDAILNTTRPLGLGPHEPSDAEQVQAELSGSFRLSMAARLAQSMDEHRNPVLGAEDGQADKEEDDLMAKIMHQMWLADQDDDEEEEGNESDDLHAQMHGFNPSSCEAGFEPYDSKLMFLLDWISSLPRLRVSRTLMKAFLFIMRECGVKNVPSFSHLHAVRQDIHGRFSVKTQRFKSALGNIFFMNSIPQMIARVRYICTKTCTWLTIHRTG
jgi:hypothetical protein